MAPAQGWHAKSWSVPHFWDRSLHFCTMLNCFLWNFYSITRTVWKVNKTETIWCLYSEVFYSKCACFGSTYTKIGTIQRRLAWPLRKDDTQNREAFHIFETALYIAMQWSYFCKNYYSMTCKIWLFSVSATISQSGVIAPRGRHGFESLLWHKV